MIDKNYIDNLIIEALKEDMPQGDITTDNIIDKNSKSRAKLIAKETGIIAGLGIAERVFKIVDKSIEFNCLILDGTLVNNKDVIAEISGNTSAMLKAERTALNILQHMSGIATKTHEFTVIVEGLPVKIYDTRKTLPGLRNLEKYAVTVGGGTNHRFGLSDAVLIKDNHIKAAGSIRNAIALVKGKVPDTIKIEVETETIEQVKEALKAKADIIMLDNMTTEMMSEAVGIIEKKALVEASGNVSKETVLNIAKTGVDIISIGSLTHSAKAFDISMKFI
ncbi:MAG: carboxylating nicotinate-nucleotide diphosphorylase [Clostridia bacterium]|jgi:nicotinate-nucleotide pyrophosphorylase (carboxylating)